MQKLLSWTKSNCLLNCSGSDGFDDSRSKSMFEAFCSERSNGVNEEDDLNIGLNDEDKFDAFTPEEVPCINQE